MCSHVHVTVVWTESHLYLCVQKLVMHVDHWGSNLPSMCEVMQSAVVHPPEPEVWIADNDNILPARFALLRLPIAPVHILAGQG